MMESQSPRYYYNMGGGAFHKHSIQALKHLNTPQNQIKRLVKYMHQLAIKCHTYLVLNMWKLNNKQEPPQKVPL